MKRGLFLILPTMFFLMFVFGLASISFFVEEDVFDEQIIITQVERNYCENRTLFCTKEYNPVCGYFFEDKIKSEIRRVYSNPCTACSDERIEYWIKGECDEN